MRIDDRKKTLSRRIACRELRHNHSAAGFTLLEVLIAMLVLAIGMLGVAAMQVRGMQYNHDAYLRSQISVLSYDIADRMRLNSDTLNAYLLDEWPVPTNNGPNCNNQQSVAANDLACWQRRLAETLPPGTLVSVSLAGEVITVRWSWEDRINAPDRMIVDYTFQP